MAFVLYGIFLIGAVLSFVEDYLSKKDKTIAVIILCLIMITTASLRDITDTRDSAMYESMYYGGAKLVFAELTEPTFTFISQTLLAMGCTVTALFMVYAVINLTIKGTIIAKLTSVPLLTLTVYMSYMYMLHDLIQIRAGAAVAFVSCAIYMLTKKKRLWAVGFILIATSFHFSAIMTMLLLLINNKTLSKRGRIILGCVLPVGFAIYLSGFNVVNAVPGAIGGDKLDIYKEQSDKGVMETANVFVEVYYMTKYLVFILSLVFYKLLLSKNKNLPLMIKIQALSIFLYCLLARVNAVLAFRTSELFSFVDCLLLAYLSYLIKPYYIGKAIVLLAGLTWLLWYTLVIDYVSF